MKNLIIIIFIFFSSQILAQVNDIDSSKFALAIKKPHTITINVLNIANDEGFLMIAMSNDKENYEDFEDPKFRKRLPINKRTCIVKFENLSFGEYAVKVYHDADGDKEMDKNLVGVPTEDYGFSNNIKPTFGPASWNEAKFLFNEENKKINISLN